MSKELSTWRAHRDELPVYLRNISLSSTSHAYRHTTCTSNRNSGRFHPAERPDLSTSAMMPDCLYSGSHLGGQLIQIAPQADVEEPSASSGYDLGSNVSPTDASVS